MPGKTGISPGAAEDIRGSSVTLPGVWAMILKVEIDFEGVSEDGLDSIAVFVGLPRAEGGDRRSSEAAPEPGLGSETSRHQAKCVRF